MENNLKKLNSVLYEQIERLNNLDVNNLTFHNEIAKSRALTNTSQQIVASTKISIDVLKVIVNNKNIKKEQLKSFKDIIGE